MDSENYEVLSDGGVKLYCTCSYPDRPAQAVLIIVHGLGEHSGRYNELAAEFLKNEIAVFTFDHRGHGQSGGKKGHAKSIEQLVEDTEQAFMKCRSIFLDIPIFLFGHSMGGQVVASYLSLIKSREVSGAIISSAWFSLVKRPPSWLINFTGILKGYLPSVTVPNGLEADVISTVAEEVEAYKNDPLVHKWISLSLFHSLYHHGLDLLKFSTATEVPVLVCHGGNDTTTSLDGSRTYAEKLGKKATFRIWKGARHEPHHDFDKANVIQFYVNWIKNQVKEISNAT
ncbi:MAG: alpha/beta hydrolase [Cyclobacteriaceae bacterium]|nr:alpha/beta hydrolase [Cyclobacteriaceae bacterium]